MPLQWVRLDTQFPHNHKIIALMTDKRSHAAFVYVCGLAYSGAQGTDGFISVGALPFIHATTQHANQLVEVGLWTPRPGGWDINDWKDYQPSNAETEARSARARAAAEIRWGKKQSPNGTVRAMR